ncbi:TerD family protein [Paenibacillus sp. HN-1]|uniref:exonuclease domain-containing protein n=1 Tax=Paenibacillus TaxID=44249 RepID=UPI001CA88B0E|nr:MULTISPECIES: exonuclease domain-containing protein [Paenibacillus]MBY9080604.1 TerD family protein [Paenibacillus sp. CGMCC 1.18879]MBY9085451.1 TerD family protein [Paenibacillus sinensis]
MNFTAIDFETANAGRSSACALGLVQVKEGQIIAEHNWLIDPQSPFDGRNIAIHGITPSMVRGKPTFGELWPTLEPLLQGQIVVAHNASFDMSVIRYCLDEAGTAYPSFQYLCTYLLGKKMLKELTSHRLDAISRHFGISLKHHDALDDARAAAGILLKLMEREGHADAISLCSSQGYSAGNLYPGGYTPFSTQIQKNSKKRSGKEENKQAAESQRVVTPNAGNRLAKGVQPTISANSATHHSGLELIKGQRIGLNREHRLFRMLVEMNGEMSSGGVNMDGAAFLLNKDGCCLPDDGFICHGRRTNGDYSVLSYKPQPDKSHLIVDFARLPNEIDRIVLALIPSDEGALAPMEWSVKTSVTLIDADSGALLVRFPFEAVYGRGSAVVAGELYRYRSEWKFNPVGARYPGGMEALCKSYGFEFAPGDAETAAAAENVGYLEGPENK